MARLNNCSHDGQGFQSRGMTKNAIAGDVRNPRAAPITSQRVPLNADNDDWPHLANTRSWDGSNDTPNGLRHDALASLRPRRGSWLRAQILRQVGVPLASIEKRTDLAMFPKAREVLERVP